MPSGNSDEIEPGPAGQFSSPLNGGDRGAARDPVPALLERKGDSHGGIIAPRTSTFPPGADFYAISYGTHRPIAANLRRPPHR
jgi:hypothetical protein